MPSKYITLCKPLHNEAASFINRYNIETNKNKSADQITLKDGVLNLKSHIETKKIACSKSRDVIGKLTKELLSSCLRDRSP